MTEKRATVSVDDSLGTTIYETESSRVTFSFHTGMDGRAGEGQVKVYGLTDNDAATIIQYGKALRLSAGDDDLTGLIFQGDIVDAFFGRTDQQQYIVVSLVDGDAFYSSYINLSVGAGESLGGLVEKCAAKGSAPLGIGFISPEAYKVRLARGTAILGCPLDTIKQIARSLNAAWYIQKGLFYLLRAEDSVQDAVTIRADDILGVPVTDNWHASFRHTLPCSLNVGQFFSLPADNGGGTYRVVSMDGIGDSKDGNWEMQITGMAQTGTLPNMSAETQNIWR